MKQPGVSLALMVVLALSGFGLAPPVHAQAVFYDQPPLAFGGTSSDGQTITVADDFRLGQAAGLEQIVWWGGYGSAHLPRPEGDAFTIRIFDDTGGRPGAVLGTYSTGTEARRTQISPTDFEYGFRLPAPLALEADRTYWLSVVNVPTSLSWTWLGSSRDHEFCTANPTCIQRSFLSPITGPWEGYYNNMSFQLLGTVSGCSEVAIELEIEPHVINLRSGGRWVTAILEPPAPYAADQIDLESVRLSTGRGSIPPDPEGPGEVGDEDHDGVADLSLKFGRADVIGLLEGNPTTLVVSGEFLEPAGLCLRGTDEVRVVPVSAPAAGQTLVEGEGVEIEWEPATDLGSHTVDVMLSRDDGETWTLEAQGLADDGRHDWISHGDGARTRIAVVMVRGSGAGDARIGVSEGFSILVPTAVGGQGGVEFALHGTRPHPAHSGAGLSVSFSLPDARPAKLVLLDIAGRRRAAREVGSLGLGRHTVMLAGDRLAAGVYRLRLTRGAESRESRVVLIP